MQRLHEFRCVYVLKTFTACMHVFLKRHKIPGSNVSFNKQIKVDALFILKTFAGKSSPEKSQHQHRSP